jgi:hypothetical protein
MMLLLLQLDHQYDVEDQPELDAFLMRYWHRRYHDKFSNLGPVFCDEELDMIATSWRGAGHDASHGTS